MADMPDWSSDEISGKPASNARAIATKAQKQIVRTRYSGMHCYLHTVLVSSHRGIVSRTAAMERIR
jgi:hypothetical protein